MIIVHDIFVCKPGNASKVAKMSKQMAQHDPNSLYVLTDVTGQYHRVVMVSRYDNLAAYEKAMEEMRNPTPEMQEAMKGMEGFQEMYLTGSREIYQTW